MKQIRYKPNFSDQRGEIFDLIEKESINAVTKISFKKDSVRGNHYHKKTTQWNFVLSGEMIVISKKNGKRTSKTFKKDDLFILQPNEHHAIKAKKKSMLLVFTKGPRGGKEYENDTFRLKNNLI